MISFTQLGRWGRLGNQMYEYAALVGIGLELGFAIAVPPLARHALGECFEITAPILTERDERGLRHVFDEPAIGFSPRYRSITDGTDLRGFFQSPGYFPPREVLVAEFTFRPALWTAATAELAPWRAVGRPVVGITVRRGDYLPQTEQYVQLGEGTYYDDAIALVADQDPVYLVSSDDPDWCRSRFVGEQFRVIDSISAYAQLALLTQCDHVILANSSFAWWAAWLNDRGGLRIAPDRWWGEQCEWPESTRDPLPEGWIEVPV
jgi:hypothetical protein